MGDSLQCDNPGTGDCLTKYLGVLVTQARFSERQNNVTLSPGGANASQSVTNTPANPPCKSRWKSPCKSP